ncbi:MAG: hypothetical protein KJ732_05815, partial [Candidatus Margulisbacteria bacterium]|nr:hypothetical protein [Candidatus Margulisiibacteriota bacterium]
MIFTAFSQISSPVIIIGIVNIIIGILVFLKNPKSLMRLLFLAFCLSVSFWNIFIGIMSLGISAEVMSFSFKASGWSGSFIPYFILLFSAVFPKEKMKFPPALIFLLTIPALVMIFLSGTDLLLDNTIVAKNVISMILGSLALPYLLYFVFYFAWTLYNLFSTMRHSKSLREKQQCGYFLLGLFLTSAIGIFCNIILVYLNKGNLVYFGPIGTIFLVGFTAYAITKAELMDIRVVISRGLAYSISGGLLVVSFVGLNYFHMPMLLAMSANALLALFWAWAAHRFREFIQTPLQEKWITGWYDSDKLLNTIALELVPVMEKQKAFEVIAWELKNAIKIKSVEVLVDQGYSSNKVKRITKGVEIPLNSSQGLEGLIRLGQKISEDSYDEKDLILFRTLQVQALAILDRIRPYEKIKEEYEANQKKLHEAEQQLERSQRLASLGTLAAGVAHEIRNPLTVIYSETERLADQARDKDYLENFKKEVLESAKRIKKITSELYSFSKAKKEKGVRVNINEVITTTLDLIPISRITLKKDFGAIPEIIADPDELRQVVINLVNNAITAMPEGGNLKIATYGKGGDACVEVSDTGQGILQENLSKIFDPFFSTH